MLAHGLRLTSHLLNEDVMLHIESASEFVSIKKMHTNRKDCTDLVT